MNIKKSIQRLSIHQTISVLVLTAAAVMAVAQDTTTKTVRHGVASFKTEARNAEVVYAEGDDLVLKLENGKVEHLIVPGNEKFTIDGQAVPASALKAGTKLTQSITTTTTPRYVNTVRTIKGKVWHVNYPTSVIVTLPDRTNVLYRVPGHAKFNIDGRPMTISSLRKGMDFEATIITDDIETVIARDKSSIGQAPAPRTPEFAGVLLIQPPAIVHLPSPARAMVASAEQPPATLPKTGTELPLAGLLGTLAAAASLGLGSVRRRLTAR